MSGSSPRAWGTLGAPPIQDRWDRFIPTCMGNSPMIGQIAAVAAVHPHVHGELIESDPLTVIPTGSSPRAWGTRDTEASGNPGDRFIPTCMGNSTDWRVRNILLSVHPHVHGELCPNSGTNSSNSGSSPRAWGTHYQDDQRRGWIRFIPTCMGNSGSTGSTSSRITVHPHVHGELSRIFIWNMEDYFLDTLMEGVSDR